MITVRFLNGDLLCIENIQNVEINELHNRVCQETGLPPSQLRLFPDQTDDTMFLAFIDLPKRCVKLSEFSAIIRHDENHEEDYDPWEIPQCEIYSDCLNDSILTRIFQIYRDMDELPYQIFTNPHPLVVKKMKQNLHLIHSRVRVNPSDELVDDLMHIDNVDFTDNPNPRATQIWFDKIVQLDQSGRGGKTEKVSFWRDLLIYTNDSYIIEYATQKLRKFEVDEQDLMYYMNDRLVYRYRQKYTKYNSHRPVCMWFVRAMLNRDFCSILKRLDTSDTLDTPDDSIYLTYRDIHPMNFKDFHKQLATVSDSDEVIEWFLDESNVKTLKECRTTLCANPHPRMVQFFIDHPQHIDWSAWITNTNPHSTEVKITREALSEICNGPKPCLYVVPQPHHMLEILDMVLRLHKNENTTYLIPMTILLESFSKSNDVEIVFDTDLQIEFLNGDVMTFPRSMHFITIKRIISRRRHIDSSTSTVELVPINDDNKYFAIIKRST